MEIGTFITKWLGVTGGAERANYGQFINDLCSALDLPEPGVATGGVLSEYQFEGPVPNGGAGGNTGAIDLYKRGCFILEAKQSRLSKAQQQQAELFDIDQAAPVSPSGARYDGLMRDALAQAKRYAVNLPGHHPWPPFLIICDVGRAFELYFDWSGNGRGYGHFPDQQSYRFELPRLTEPEVQDMFRAIWTDPARIDPRSKSAEVTGDVARKLALISKNLEEQTRPQARDAAAIGQESTFIERTSLFLMRIVFCMFAEDVGLLPKGKFKEFLESCTLNDRENHASLIDSEKLSRGLQDLWQKMGSATLTDRWTWSIQDEVRYFNGGLFRENLTYVLSRNDLDDLISAARYRWTKVEPAIFGTLLEQALTPAERAKLGAHYTPRPYVETLVQATIMDVLDGEWDAIAHAHDSTTAIDLAAAQAFHQRLAALRILDPACGTGNFLYVAMENLMRLESDVIETIRQLGGDAMPQVGPQQFLGLELNPRAAVIAELVLWIGWLRWRMQNDPDAAPDPVLKQFGNINFGGHFGYDAVLRRTVTGEADTANPMIPEWPAADFIIGNPPFIGGKDLRAKLGSDYAEALWQANPRVPKSADFVMQWWDRAAHILVAENSPLIRFGFVTTNSITQEFSRRVMAQYLDAGQASLVMAIPDHPWIKPPRIERQVKGSARIARNKRTDGTAAVRIAMTVAASGTGPGRFIEVVSETALDSDKPQVDLSVTTASINANLSIAADVSQAQPLLANAMLGYRGVQLIGAGFIVSPAEAAHLGLGKRDGLERHIRPYLNGRDMVQHSRGKLVIDLLGLDEKEVRQRFPEVYQHLLLNVKPERDANRRASYKKYWWVHGEPRRDLRPALAEIPRYIATVESAKHRIFQFLDAAILPDNKLLAIGTDDAAILGVLASDIHVHWSLATGGWLGMGNDSVYVKSKCFDPFPFPDASDAQRRIIADLAEELDTTRKIALADVPGLTMTEIYNLRDALRSSNFTDFAQEDRARQARAGIVHKLHDDIDAAVADAYGWGDDWRSGTLSPAQIVTRLVALNQQRAQEEAAGHIRWLRPDYQIPRFGAGKPG